MEIDDTSSNSQESLEVRIVCGPCGLAHHTDEGCQVCYLPYLFIPGFNPFHVSSQRALAIEAKNRPDKKRKAESSGGLFSEHIFCTCLRISYSNVTDFFS